MRWVRLSVPLILSLFMGCPHLSLSVTSDAPANIHGLVEISEPTELSANKAVYCNNPLSFAKASGQPIKRRIAIAPGQWKIVAMDLYILDQGTRNSVFVTSHSQNKFMPQLICNGMNQPKKGSLNEITLSAQVSVADFAVFPGPTFSYDDRFLAVEFKNGQLVSASSLLGERDDGYSQRSGFDGPFSRHEVTPGFFVTTNIYHLDDSHLEIRALFEFPGNGRGQRVFEFARAEYERQAK